jgi:hypothetical protein
MTGPTEKLPPPEQVTVPEKAAFARSVIEKLLTATKGIKREPTIAAITARVTDWRFSFDPASLFRVSFNFTPQPYRSLERPSRFGIYIQH